MSHATEYPRIKKPCAGCPWKTAKDSKDIPWFSLEKAESLAETSPCERGFGPEYSATMFACHQSELGDEFACAGWLATVGNAHPAVRLAVATGRLSVEALSPGKDWPELHSTFQQVIEKLRTSAK